MKYSLIAIFIAIYLVGVVSLIYQIYNIVVTDAKARGLKHPRLIGLLATSGRSSEGLIVYLLTRKKYSIKDISFLERQEIMIRKKIILVSLMFMAIGGIGFVYGLVLMI
jgi:hypothetical protein